MVDEASPQTRMGAGEPTARMRAFVAALTIGTVGAVPHGFLRGRASQIGNLTRYTPYLARQLTAGDYHEQGFVGTPI